MDQGCFATAHFILNVLLARWLEPGEYGAFVVAYSAYLLPASLHTALLTDPALVFLPGRYSGTGAAYSRFLTRTHWWLASVVGCLVLIIALVIGAWGNLATARTLAVLGLGAPALLLVWYARRFEYACRRVDRAALGSATYLGLVVAGIILLNRSASLSALSAVVLLSVCSLGVGLWMQWGRRPAPGDGGGSPATTEFLRAHWWAGGLGVASNAVAWIPSNFVYCALPVWQGVEGSAGVRAILNLAMPVFHASSAISGALVPDLVSARRCGGERRFQIRLGATAGLFLSLCLIFLLIVMTAGSSILNLLYGGRYQFTRGTLIAAGLLPFVTSATALLAAVLRAREEFRRVLGGHIVGALAAVVVGLPCVAFGGITAALVAQICAYAASASALALAFYRAELPDPRKRGSSA